MTLRVRLNDTAVTGGQITFVHSVSISNSGPSQHPSNMPAAIPADQAYYWSVPWQDDVRESLAALKAGEFEDFSDSDDPNDVVRWFLADDDE